MGWGWGGNWDNCTRTTIERKGEKRKEGRKQASKIAQRWLVFLGSHTLLGGPDVGSREPRRRELNQILSHAVKRM